MWTNQIDNGANEKAVQSTIHSFFDWCQLTNGYVGPAVLIVVVVANNWIDAEVNRSCKERSVHSFGQFFPRPPWRPSLSQHEIRVHIECCFLSPPQLVVILWVVTLCHSLLHGSEFVLSPVFCSSLHSLLDVSIHRFVLWNSFDFWPLPVLQCPSGTILVHGWAVTPCHPGVM